MSRHIPITPRVHVLCNAPINVSPPLPGEVGQSWGFELIRIQLPHTPGNVRIQILTGHALRVFRMRTLAIQYPDPWGKRAIPNKQNSPPCPVWGGVGANIDRRIRGRDFNSNVAQWVGQLNSN